MGAPLLIIGYGNTLRRDDGVGPTVVSRLEEQFGQEQRVAFMTVQQLVPEIAAELDARRVVLIDAAMTLNPGDVHVQRVHPGTVLRRSLTHHVAGSYLLGLAQALHGRVPGTVSIAIGAGDWAVGEGLSPAVKAAAERVIARLGRYIRRVVARDARIARNPFTRFERTQPCA
jgi:hydrogenase maturation protease